MFKKYLQNRLEKYFESSLVVLNKKAGITSHDEIYNLRKIFGIKKIGHSGTLDPKVTGVLVCGFSKGTRVLEYILMSEKKYEAVFEFHAEIKREVFEQSLKKFLGKIVQLPPVKSAVKRQEREREIYGLKILDYDKKNRWAKILCSVERGTYIRKLAHDIGQEIGINISMGPLHRIQAGVFSEVNSNMITSEKLRVLMGEFEGARNWRSKFRAYLKLKKHLYSIEELFNREKKILKVFIKKEAVKYISAGNAVRIKNLKESKNLQKGQIVSIFYKNKVLAVGGVIFSLQKEEKDEKEIIKIKKVLI